MNMSFADYLLLVTEAAGQRVDIDTVLHFYNKDAAVMDCVVALIYRQS